MSDLPPAPHPSGARPSPRRWAVPAIVVAVALLVAFGAWRWWGRAGVPAGASAGATKTTGMFGDGAKAGAARGGRFAVDPNRAQPVAAAAARMGDVDIVQTALGTVTALRTVTVRPARRRPAPVACCSRKASS